MVPAATHAVTTAHMTASRADVPGGALEARAARRRPLAVHVHARHAAMVVRRGDVHVGVGLRTVAASRPRSHRRIGRLGHLDVVVWTADIPRRSRGRAHGDTARSAVGWATDHHGRAHAGRYDDLWAHSWRYYDGGTHARGDNDLRAHAGSDDHLWTPPHGLDDDDGLGSDRLDDDHGGLWPRLDNDDWRWFGFLNDDDRCRWWARLPLHEDDGGGGNRLVLDDHGGWLHRWRLSIHHDRW